MCFRWVLRRSVILEHIVFDELLKITTKIKQFTAVTGASVNAEKIVGKRLSVFKDKKTNKKYNNDNERKTNTKKQKLVLRDIGVGRGVSLHVEIFPAQRQ